MGSITRAVVAESDGGWKVVPYGENYYAATFAICFLSRKACLGAPAQLPAGRRAVATQDIIVPAAGEYQCMGLGGGDDVRSTCDTTGLPLRGEGVYAAPAHRRRSGARVRRGRDAAMNAPDDATWAAFRQALMRGDRQVDAGVIASGMAAV